MDPDTCWREIKAARRLVSAFLKEGKTELALVAAKSLVQHSAALDLWILSGGRFPRVWLYRDYQATLAKQAGCFDETCLPIGGVEKDE